MLERDVERALFARLGELGSDMTLVFPGQGHGGAKPYVTVRNFRNRSRLVTLQGLAENPGILQLVIVVEKGPMAIPQTMEIAALIAAKFPVNLRLPTGNYTVEISQKPDVSSPERVGEVFRTMVSIYHLTFGS